MNRLYGISAKLSRSAKKEKKESICLEICSCDKQKPRKEHIERVTDHRKATFKMISYAYKMCAQKWKIMELRGDVLCCTLL